MEWIKICKWSLWLNKLLATKCLKQFQKIRSLKSHDKTSVHQLSLVTCEHYLVYTNEYINLCTLAENHKPANQEGTCHFESAFVIFV